MVLIIKPDNLCSRFFDQKVLVFFRNTLSEAVVLCWIDPDGDEHEICTIQKGWSVGQRSYHSHVWLMKLHSNRSKIVGLYVLDDKVYDGNEFVCDQVYNNSPKVIEPLFTPLTGEDVVLNKTPVSYECKRSKQPGAIENVTGCKSNTGGEQLALTVNNRTDYNLDIFWIDFSGSLRHCGRLAPESDFNTLTGTKQAFYFKSCEEGKDFERVVRVSADRPIEVLEKESFTINAVSYEGSNESSCHEVLKSYKHFRTGGKYMAFDSSVSCELISNIYHTLKSQKKRFVDEDFPPENDWKRAFDFFSNTNDVVSIFKGEISAVKPTQGWAGDCWLIGSLSGAAKLPSKLQEVFYECEALDPFIGLYSVTFHNSDGKMTVLLDDYFPLHQFGFHYGKTNSSGELWVSLIEKAFAKLIGYQNYKGLHPSFSNHSYGPGSVLAMLLGGKARETSWRYENTIGQEKIKDGTFWPFLEELIDSDKSAVSCTSRDKNASQNVNETGLVDYHAYSILGYKKYAQHNLKLIHMRNTWGRQEWNGLWSDTSDIWTQYPDVKKEIHSIADDGCFWMSYDDFIENYCVIWYNSFE